METSDSDAVWTGRPYLHHAQYYETDQMGMIHHSNYIRWMEEARVDFLHQIGFSYRKMESLGVFCPVLAVQCDYKSKVQFDDQVKIEVGVVQYTGTRLTIAYRMTNLSTDTVCTLASSKHCFLGEGGRPISLKRSHPEMHALFSGLLATP